MADEGSHVDSGKTTGGSLPEHPLGSCSPAPPGLTVPREAHLWGSVTAMAGDAAGFGVMPGRTRFI